MSKLSFAKSLSNNNSSSSSPIPSNNSSFSSSKISSSSNKISSCVSFSYPSNSSSLTTTSSVNTFLSWLGSYSTPSSIFSFNSSSWLSSEYRRTSNPNDCNSFTKTLKLSGTPGSGTFSPFTID